MQRTNITRYVFMLSLSKTFGSKLFVEQRHTNAKPSNVLTRPNATYIIPCSKICDPTSQKIFSVVVPCALWIEIAQAKHIGKKVQV